MWLVEFPFKINLPVEVIKGTTLKLFVGRLRVNKTIASPYTMALIFERAAAYRAFLRNKSSVVISR